MIFSIQMLCTSYFIINVLGKECNISKHRYTIRNDVFLIRYCSLFSKEALHWYSLFENQYVEGKIHFIVVNKNIPLMAWGKERIVLQLYVKWTHMYVIWYEGPNEKNSEYIGFSCSNWFQSPNLWIRTDKYTYWDIILVQRFVLFQISRKTLIVAKIELVRIVHTTIH